MADIFPGAKHLQLAQWGFPMGSLRPVPPKDKAWSVIHITANLATAENEWGWRSDGNPVRNSATFFVNRNGAAVQMLGDPLRMDPWANGDVNTPDVSNPRIAAMVRDRVNANERTLVAIENVGNETAWGSVPGGFPITPEQEETCARIIAYYHPKAGVPISRETVIGHYQLNSVSRPNCPSRNKAILDRIVARARAIATGDDMPTPPLNYLPELWKTEASGADLREQADLAAPIIDKIPAGTPVFTVASSADDNWRLAVAGDPERLLWARKHVLDPAVNPPNDAQLYSGIASIVNARLAGQPSPIGDPNCQAALATAKQTIEAQTDIIAEQKTRISAARTALGSE